MKKILLTFLILAPLLSLGQFTVNYRMEGSTKESFETITVLKGKKDSKILYNNSKLDYPLEAKILDVRNEVKEGLNFTILLIKFDEWQNDEFALMYGYNSNGNFAMIFNVNDINKPSFKPSRFWLEHPETEKKNSSENVDWSSFAPLLKLLF